MFFEQVAVTSHCHQHRLDRRDRCFACKFNVFQCFALIMKMLENRSKNIKNRRKIDENSLPKGWRNHVCENTAKNYEKVRPRSQNVVPRLAPGLQNDALEPSKFIKNSDLDPSKRQDVPPEPNLTKI